MDLKKALIDLSKLNVHEIEKLGRELYKKNYIDTSKNFGSCQTHDGEIVIFWEDRFDHAFFTSSNRVKHPQKKDVLAIERIERINWIKSIITGQANNTSCWLVSALTGRTNPPNRLYTSFTYNYVVWLEPRLKGGWKFSSAYTASIVDIRRYCKGGKKIWTQKKKTP